MPRLFTGLAVPPHVADALKAYQGGLPGARWIEPRDFHITLRFLGDVEATVADDVVEALGEMRTRPPLTAQTILSSATKAPSSRLASNSARLDFPEPDSPRIRMPPPRSVQQAP